MHLFLTVFGSATLCDVPRAPAIPGLLPPPMPQDRWKDWSKPSTSWRRQTLWSFAV